MRQSSAWSARWQSCSQAAEISRTVSSEVRGERCFLQFCADLSHEHEEQTICLTVLTAAVLVAFAAERQRLTSTPTLFPRWCTTGRGACPSRTSVGSQMDCRAPQCATARTRPAGNAGMLATCEFS